MATAAVPNLIGANGGGNGHDILVAATGGSQLDGDAGNDLLLGRGGADRLFGGSGSTLIAAEQTGRRAYLLELDPLYCDVICQRFERFSGKKPERVSGAADVPGLGAGLEAGGRGPGAAGEP